MRTAAKLTYVAAVLLLAGCSSLSSLNPFGKSDKRNPPAALVDFKQTQSVRTAWSTSIGSSREYVFSPAMSSGSVFAASADGSITRIDTATGRHVWRMNAGT